MRALLVVNPKATSTSARTRDVLIRALGSDLEIEIGVTEHRGHAADLAEQAARAGTDLVVVLGGDGTVNEAVNGLMRVSDRTARPAFAVVPGGSANVFSRVLGQPSDPVEATGTLLEALRAGRHTTISLGMANDRYFTFCAGIGLDAEVVARVEQRRGAGARATPLLYARTAVRHYGSGARRRHARLLLELPGEETADQVAMVIVCNTSPWTYCGERALDPTPGCGFDTGLDVFAMRKLRLFSTLNTLRQMAGGEPRGRLVLRRHDLPDVTVAATEPMALQVDGDYCGMVEKVVFRDVPAALDVIA